MEHKEPVGTELKNRYKKNYNIPENINITEEMIIKHWELEKKLTKELWKSTAENRWDIFERCYTQLYNELEWINKYAETDSNLSSSERFWLWPNILGTPPLKIYEIGSGKGELITYLAEFGYICTGTEITRERGKKHINENVNLNWNNSDGVHLDKFEELDSYDIVISNQVIEHIHPNDLILHFKSVRNILVNKGKYIFTTPHNYTGPADITRVFGYDQTMGMHLKEYTYSELKNLLIESGFKNIYAVWYLPDKIRSRFKYRIKYSFLNFVFESKIYLKYLILIEKIIGLFPNQKLKRQFSQVMRIVLYNPSIFIIAQK